MANTYIQIGNGPIKVIALHGWFGSGAGWGPFMQVLDEQRFTYAFMDYRGYGGSKGVQGEYTMKEIAGDTLALADRLGWQQFDLIGHSMGGKAIQQVLADAPARVRKLVAVTPVPAAEVPFDEAGWQLFTSAAKSRKRARAFLISRPAIGYRERGSSEWSRTRSRTRPRTLSRRIFSRGRRAISPRASKATPCLCW